MNDRKNTAVADAPLVTPIISGEASGLRIIVCNSRPETASAPPASSAISILGARKMETIKALSAIVWLRKALATSASDSMYLPEASDSIATASVTSSNRIITVQACVSIWREYQLLRKTSRLSIAHPLSGHMDKKRRTKQCGDDADRHFLGNQHDTRQHVSKQ